MFKFFTSDLRRNIIKILCLAIGLSIGLLLVARVYFDKTYDTFFSDADSTYILYESVERDGEYSQHPTLSGGYIPAFKEAIPQIEVATRFNNVIDATYIELADGRKIDIDNVCCTDEYVFDIFDVPVSGGNPKDILLTGGSCIIPRSLAEKIGGDVIGATFKIPQVTDKKFMVGGIYDDFPLNSTLQNGLFFGMESFPDYTHGRDNFNGNDVYHSYIRLIPGATIDQVMPGISKIVEQNAADFLIEQFHFRIGAEKLSGYYAAKESIRTQDLMLSLLAVVLLMSSGFNFLLIVIGQVGKRSKEMAVRKCYGTSDARIFGRVMGESLFYLVASVIIGVLTVFCFPELCSRLLGYTPEQLFTTGNVWIVIIGVCLLLLVLTGVIPAWIYCRTPVASAFRGNLKSRRGWKIALLSIQFFAAGVLMCLLVLVVRQYRMVTEVKNGFDDEDVAFVQLFGTKVSGRNTFVSELKNLSCVKDDTTANELIGLPCSGNIVWMNGNDENVVNVADNYSVNSNFFEMMGIEFLQGETFKAQADSTIHQVVVEKAFIDVVKKLTGDDSDYIVGKSFKISEHGFVDYTICGVINDIKRGDPTFVDGRAGVWFPSSRSLNKVYIKLDGATPENLSNVQDVMDKVFPGNDYELITISSYLEAKNAPISNFATSVMIAGIAILFIALIGLIGYTGDEVQRRSKEIAIRKVTGTPARKIVELFCRNILTVAVPSLILGAAVAMIVGRKWLTQFVEQVSLSPFSMILCVIVLLLLITGVVTYSTIGVATSNPINHLRNE